VCWGEIESEDPTSPGPLLLKAMRVQ
jgi:hypothetical protein